MARPLSCGVSMSSNPEHSVTSIEISSIAFEARASIAVTLTIATDGKDGSKSDMNIMEAINAVKICWTFRRESS